MSNSNLSPIFGGVVYWCARINRWLDRLSVAGDPSAHLAESAALFDCATALESLLYLLPLTPESQWAFGPCQSAGWDGERRAPASVRSVQELPAQHRAPVLIWALTTRGTLEEMAADLSRAVAARRKRPSGDQRADAEIVAHLLAAASCLSDFAWHLEHVAHHLQFCVECGASADVEEEPGQCLKCGTFTTRALGDYWSSPESH